MAGLAEQEWATITACVLDAVLGWWGCTGRNAALAVHSAPQGRAVGGYHSRPDRAPEAMTLNRVVDKKGLQHSRWVRGRKLKQD